MRVAARMIREELVRLPRSRPSRLLGVAVLALTLAAGPPASAQDAPAGSAAAVPSVELPPDLARVLRDYERAWAASDAAGLAGLFTDDGFALPSGRPPVRGREAIAEHYRNAAGPLGLRALAYATEGSVGWIVGAYGYGEDAADRGKFVLALRREADGAWHIAADMDNANRRPEP